MAHEQNEQTATTPLMSLPWDVLENVLAFVEAADIVKFACASRMHYGLAHGYLWRKPCLTLTQTMLFTRFVYRRPIVTDALPPDKESLVQWERPLCVKTVTLHFEREQEVMFDTARDAVQRLARFCPDAIFEIHVSSILKPMWEQSLTNEERSRMRIVEVCQEAEKAEL